MASKLKLEPSTKEAKMDKIVAAFQMQDFAIIITECGKIYRMDWNRSTMTPLFTLIHTFNLEF